jgi:ATP-dependent DNA helicase RecQ
MKQSGAEAFASLVQIINGEIIEVELEDLPFDRLYRAIKEDDASHLERAILLRQALRYESLRRKKDVTIDTNKFEEDDLARVGIEARPVGDLWRLKAKPWTPDWLPDAKIQAVDETAMLAPRKRFFEGQSTPGDPFLTEFNLPGYRSKGQRSAVRSALSMPPGKTLVIDLPTGEGKSLVFRVIDRVGFSIETSSAKAQLTIVIVPTVTLAFDHERSCEGNASNPLAYIGGQTKRNARIKENINSGEQRLLFAAPEAIVGPLRIPISKAVAKGCVRAIVIDEAHLVESWGTGFRTEFQTFAGVYQQWRKQIPEAKHFRLIFLSATLSKIAKSTLEELFSPEESLTVVSAAALRPEPEFWISDLCDRETRENRTIEALLHLPRPAILYVTEVADAEYWCRRVREEEGMVRFRMVHGGTRAIDREEALKKWADGSLDLVVATSAFGLGIDYPHVRSVIHACLPEKLDRFYQEVGRSGRDGCASISMLLPANEDIKVAKSLSNQTVITVQRGFQRWCAMFNHPSRVNYDNMTFGLRMDIAPSNSPENIDLVGRRSIDWNARVLSLMARSNLIRLAGIPNSIDQEDGGHPPIQNVEIINDGHLKLDVWEEKVEAKRTEIATSNNRSFELLKQLLDNEDCPGELIANIYEGSAHSCTGCRKCRMDKSCRRGQGLVKEPRIPWPLSPQLTEGITTLTGGANRMVIEYPQADIDRRTRGDFEAVIKRLDLVGFRVLVIAGMVPEWISNAFDKILKDKPWIVIRSANWQRALWPNGNTIIVAGPDMGLSAGHLTRNTPKFPEAIFIPERTTDYDAPHRLIRDVLPASALTLSKFFARFLR